MLKRLKIMPKMVAYFIIFHSSLTNLNHTWGFGYLVGKFKRYYGIGTRLTRLKQTWGDAYTFLEKDKEFYYFIFLLAIVAIIIPTSLLSSIIDWESVNVGTHFPWEIMQDNYSIWNDVSIYFDFFLLLTFIISATLYWFVTNYSTVQIFYVFLSSFYICLFFLSSYLMTKYFNILTLENIIFDTYIYVGDDLILVPHVLLQICLIAICFSVFLLIIDARTISVTLKRILPNSSIVIKILELGIWFLGLTYGSIKGLDVTIQTSPLSFLSIENLLWLSNWVKSDVLFVAIILLYIKTTLIMTIHFFRHFISDRYVKSSYIKFALVVVSHVIIFLITLFTIGGAIGVIVKCYYSYVSGTVVTGILFTICGGSIVIWRRLLRSEIMLVIENEISSYVLNSRYEKEVITKELIPYLNNKFLIHLDQIEKVFHKEGYYCGLKFIKDHVNFFQTKFAPSSQSKEVIIEPITSSSSWGTYIVVGVVVVIIILVAGYGVYKYYNSNNLERKEQGFFGTREDIQKDALNNLTTKHALVLQKFHKNIVDLYLRI